MKSRDVVLGSQFVFISWFLSVFFVFIVNVSGISCGRRMSDRLLHVTVLILCHSAGYISGSLVHNFSFVFGAAGGRVRHAFAGCRSVRTLYCWHHVPSLELYSGGRHA